MQTYFVDSFTTTRFAGNPAAVCLPAHELSAATMQQVAREIGFSETAFLRPAATGSGYRIRFFTPKQEIPLCGHATLAAAKVLFETTGRRQALFVNHAGIELPCEQAEDSIRMRFPVYPTEALPVPAAVLQALGLATCLAARYSQRNKIILLEIASAAALAELQPDFEALLRAYDGINGVLVTAPGDTPAYDFHYRYFWPWAGTNEDPVTGGVHTFLTKYWADKLGKPHLRAFQSSLRTGHMRTELLADGVHIYGEAVLVLAGTFYLEPHEH
ncbi:PhzF family phenazine biosynthesis protein [Hymenobacter swuensis]|uniref:PhzF family phenazine biosynthesis protein n=1 Tax=Hymenobacter swuensis DY53 TaxID=1227739 RepID=W8EQT7_9BACT|nr:PhzF family phenazine biosynthesis isomerase [Hymenobacter swuensis]AHJ95499.1 PhzF family phenazine biosynthesis protein [Hymenobacter swuensis DY53]